MDTNIITGAMTALITPFKNGKLDEEAYYSLIKRQISYGIDAVAGTISPAIGLYDTSAAGCLCRFHGGPLRH